MNQGQTVLAQVLRFLSHDEFRRFVDRYDGNRGVRRMSESSICSPSNPART